MKKEYIKPILIEMKLSEELCLNATSSFADEQPAGARTMDILYDENWEEE